MHARPTERARAAYGRALAFQLEYIRSTVTRCKRSNVIVRYIQRINYPESSRRNPIPHESWGVFANAKPVDTRSCLSVCNQPGYEAKKVHAAIASYNRPVNGTLSVVSRLSKCRGFTVWKTK